MDSMNAFFHQLYNDFNNRQIDKVTAHMTNDVQWANGMEGGYVHGHDGVKAYWTKQFAMVSSNVTPLEIIMENDVVKIKVHQVVHDLDGKVLMDEIVYHFFYLKDGMIVKFEIEAKS